MCPSRSPRSPLDRRLTPWPASVTCGREPAFRGQSGRCSPASSPTVGGLALVGKPRVEVHEFGTVAALCSAGPEGARRRSVVGVLTADRVVNAISPVLDDIVRLSERVRVVGTASSSLRGIVLPVADIDILGRDRATVDELVAASASPPPR